MNPSSNRKLAKFLWIEDVYVTGLLRQHTNFTLVDIPSRHVVSDLSNSKSMNRSAIFWGPTSLKFNEFEIVKKLIHSWIWSFDMYKHALSI